jgi:hypothetical protein
MLEQLAQFLHSAMPAFAVAACAIGACCENIKDK